MNLGQSLTTIRKKKGLRQIKACEGIGITQTYLSQIETNKKNPSIDVLDKIGEFYEIPMPVLFWFSLSGEDIPDSAPSTRLAAAQSALKQRSWGD